MSILTKILDQKKIEVAALNLKTLSLAAPQSPAPLNFLAEIQQRRSSSRPGLIAELKRASPSKGILAPHLDLAEVARIYAANGASAISVVTDQKFFQGNLETLCSLRHKLNIGLPLLRKDFIIDETQLYETRLNGADAVLLIAAALLDNVKLAELHALALDLELTPLVEVHNKAEVDRVLRLKNLKLVGINNRNLETFEVSLETTVQLRPLIPSSIAVVAESGIFTAADVKRLAQTQVDAILVGEALITSTDIASKVRELSGISNQN